ncbi:MAG: hypothetical protein U1F43_34915 [Myxococcota bacterium]
MATSGPRSATSASAWKDALVRYRPRLARAYPPRWDGTSPDGAPIAFEPRAVGPDRVGLDVALAVATGAPGLVVMARAQALTDAGGFATGDAEFDAEVVVLAGDAHAGLFDAMARRRLRALVALGGWVADDSLHLDAAASLAVGPDGLAAVVDAMDRVARRPRGRARQRVARPAHRARRSNPAVRTLPRAEHRAPTSSARAERAIAAAGDDDDGFAVLATHLADHSLPDALRLAAAEAPGRGLPARAPGRPRRRLAPARRLGDFGPRRPASTRRARPEPRCGWPSSSPTARSMARRRAHRAGARALAPDRHDAREPRARAGRWYAIRRRRSRRARSMPTSSARRSSRRYSTRRRCRRPPAPASRC